MLNIFYLIYLKRDMNEKKHSNMTSDILRKNYYSKLMDPKYFNTIH